MADSPFSPQATPIPPVIPPTPPSPGAVWPPPASPAPAAPAAASLPASASPLDEELDVDAEDAALDQFSPARVLSTATMPGAGLSVSPMSTAVPPPPPPVPAAPMPAPAAPAPVPSIAQAKPTIQVPALSREELLQQAAAAPTDPFALPQMDEAAFSSAQEAAAVPGRAPQGGASASSKNQLFGGLSMPGSANGGGGAPIVPQRDDKDLDDAPTRMGTGNVEMEALEKIPAIPTKTPFSALNPIQEEADPLDGMAGTNPLDATIPPIPFPVPTTPMMPVPPANPAAPEVRKDNPILVGGKKKGNPLRLLLVIVVFLGLVGGGLTGAVYGGIRIPVLYTAISKISPDGMTLALNAKEFVQMRAYQAVGVTNVTQVVESTTTELPGGNTGGAVKVALVKAVISQNSAQVEAGEKPSWMMSADVTINEGEPVPLVLDSAAAGGTLGAVFPNNAVTKQATVPAIDLAKHPLFTSLRPDLISAILASATNAHDYVNGKASTGERVARYTYTLDPTIFAKAFPDGALTFTEPEAQVGYAWGTGAPIAFTLGVTATYQSHKYTVTGNWKLSNWDGTTPEELATAVAPLHTGSDTVVIPAISAQQFLAQLGITDNLPAPVSQTGALEPTGIAIASVGDPITTVPAASTASAQDALTRDNQRKLDLELIQEALAAYQAKEGKYPVVTPYQQTRSSKTLFAALVPKYLGKMPVDPLAEVYWYEYSSTDGSDYLLRSVAENTVDVDAKKGAAFSYFEATKATTFKAHPTKPAVVASPSPSPSASASPAASASPSPSPSTLPSAR